MDRCVVMNEGCATSDDVNATPLQEKEKKTFPPFMKMITRKNLIQILTHTLSRCAS